MIGDTNLEQKVYLACGSSDMRKSIDGLAVIVQQVFALDPFSPCLFVFCNRQKDRLKILHWDHSGFWLHYRRLERGRFQWPDASQKGPLQISRRELHWLLDGLELKQDKAHEKVLARAII